MNHTIDLKAFSSSGVALFFSSIPKPIPLRHINVKKNTIRNSIIN
ncbi:hypothetical protein OAN93_01065 [Candidatus Marinimicrobia bacterium]|nr:hypothetical protein [Candidatus Neomarinimicrobiota bacterium]